MSSNKKFLFIAIALIGAVFFFGKKVYDDAQTQKIAESAKQNEGILIRDHSPSIGTPMARISLVEFLDPECESCRRFHPIVKKILEKYDGRIHYVIRYAPFHGNSELAIKALYGADKQGKYWEALDILFEKLPEWGSHSNPRPELIWTYFADLGLNVDEIKANLDNPEVLKMIKLDREDLEKFHVRGTPTFFVNGKPLPSFGVKQLHDAIESAAN